MHAYFDNHPTDRRLPHITNPARPVSAETLAKLGVLSVASERGYKNRDVINVSREGMGSVYEEKIRGLFEEHMHEDKEISFPLHLVLKLSFMVKTPTDAWIRIAVTPGDLLVLPAGIYHRFTLDTKHPQPEKVTATTPFLPSNSNADIFIQTRNQFIRRNFNCNIQLHSSSDFPYDRPQVTVHVFPTLPARLIPPNRDSPRNAAIAASVVVAIVVFTVAIVWVRIRRRKLRIRERRIPNQFLDAQEHIVQKLPAEKGTVPAGAEINQSPLLSAPMLDDTERKQTSPRDNPDNVLLTDIPIVVPEETAATSSEPPLEASQHGEETMSLRMSRLEAQMTALLAENPPPKYSD
ncbi:1,2-dihydroxy-3-keto-5-methylthiopentene dioxygenase [Mycena sanguinolenta]|uniref:acireductone dioxygenase (Fe(2+)-requiring) n=1 Tax=Mycena sanguinolenta TaxID=230812 RepID=A0A8H6Y3L5_9AGAR|nr:1,2-dihydroxy-3-keto-5-methylthiopentene dioxygenase [Mycena sanguinolenta]